VWAAERSFIRPGMLGRNLPRRLTRTEGVPDRKLSRYRPFIGRSAAAAVARDRAAMRRLSATRLHTSLARRLNAADSMADSVTQVRCQRRPVRRRWGTTIFGLPCALRAGLCSPLESGASVGSRSIPVPAPVSRRITWCVAGKRRRGPKARMTRRRWAGRNTSDTLDHRRRSGARRRRQLRAKCQHSAAERPNHNTPERIPSTDWPRIARQHGDIVDGGRCGGCVWHRLCLSSYAGRIGLPGLSSWRPVSGGTPPSSIPRQRRRRRAWDRISIRTGVAATASPSRCTGTGKVVCKRRVPGVARLHRDRSGVPLVRAPVHGGRRRPVSPDVFRLRRHHDGAVGKGERGEPRGAAVSAILRLSAATEEGMEWKRSRAPRRTATPERVHASRAIWSAH
jgi:hypothetical protein